VGDRSRSFALGFRSVEASVFRLAPLIGLAVGALLGYLASSDLDTSLGAAKAPLYVALGAVYGGLVGMVCRPPVRVANRTLGPNSAPSAAPLRDLCNSDRLGS
jgi:hypothetical protein